MKKAKRNAAIFVSHADGQPLFRDNEGNVSEPGKEEKFETLTKSKGRVFLFAAEGVDVITAITIDDDSKKIVKSKTDEDGGKYWIIKIRKREEGTAKYTLHYTDTDGATHKVDPIMRIEGTS